MRALLAVAIRISKCNTSHYQSRHAARSPTLLPRLSLPLETKAPMTANPMTANPMTANPVTANPASPNFASQHPRNLFKARLGKQQQIGFFSTLASPSLTELLAGCGFDWVLIDTEHSPVELPDVIHHLRAVNAPGVSALVRPAWNDMVTIKRLLDQGAQTLLIPYVENAEEARAAVSYTRFPPHGVRGVSSASRAANYGLTQDYFRVVEQELCVIVQIETAEALSRIEEIASVEGVDAVFIGPSDLSASMGHLGNAQHPEVQAAIDDGFRRLKAIGKPAGYLSGNEDEFRRRLAEGVDFISFATDAVIARNAAKGLVGRLRR
jgi:4-hydroxy-2-oxoheptanedioate aldolase